MTDPIHIANPHDHDYDTLFCVSFGAYGDTHVYVWTHGDSCEDAWEEAVDWLDDNAPGHFVTIDESDLRDAVKDHCGVDWPDDEPCTWQTIEERWDNDVASHIWEAAEVDLTSVSHTTLQHAPNPAYIPSWEWTLREVTEPEEFERVRHESLPAMNVKSAWLRDFRAGWRLWTVNRPLSSDVEPELAHRIQMLAHRIQLALCNDDLIIINLGYLTAGYFATVWPEPPSDWPAGSWANGYHLLMKAARGSNYWLHRIGERGVIVGQK